MTSKERKAHLAQEARRIHAQLNGATADPNPHNPLKIRTRDGIVSGAELDQNLRNLTRESEGAWNGRAYKKNEKVWYQGIEFIAWNDIPAGKAPDVIQNIANPVDWVATDGTHGRGSMRLDTPTGTPGSIPVGGNPNPDDNWVTIPFDTQPYLPFGIEFDLVNDTFDLDYNGLWDFSLLLSFSHNESNQGRDFRVRIYDVIDGVGAGGIKVFVARNQPGTTQQLIFDWQVTDLVFGHTFRFEAGEASQVITGITWETTQLIARQSGILTQ